MSDLEIIEIIHQQTTIEFVEEVLVLEIPSGFGVSLDDFKVLMNSLPSYADDIAARADGKDTGDLYWYSIDTDTGIYNTLKRVSPII